MKKTISSIGFLLFFCASMLAQPPLVHQKFIEHGGILNSGFTLNNLGDGGNYLIKLRANQSPIFPDFWNDDVALPMSFPSTLGGDSYLFYDAELSFFTSFQLSPFTNDRAFIPYQNGVLINFISGVDASIFESDPEISNLTTGSENFNKLIQFDAANNSAIELYHLDHPSGSTSNQPYLGFNNATSDSYSSFRTSLLSTGNIHIATSRLYQTHVLNSTTVIENTTGSAGYIWLSTDLNSGETEAIDVQSGNGNIHSLATFPTADESGIYHLAITRGGDTKVAPFGDNLITEPNDSLYRVHISHIDAEGTLQWLTPLFSYNNTQSDTLISGNPDASFPTNATNRFVNLLTKENELFLSYRMSGSLKQGDSLLFEGPFGETGVFANAIPLGINHSPMSRTGIMKLSDNGEMLGHWYANAPNVSLTLTYSTIIADKLVFLVSFILPTDTLVSFMKVGAGGTTDTTFVSFPSGSGAAVMWVDTDLNVLDTWYMRDLNPPNLTPSILLTNLTPFGTDTLIVQGVTRGNANSSFAFNGDFSPQSPQSNSVFISFFHEPGLLVATPDRKPDPITKLFPNPSNGAFHIQVSPGRLIDSWVIFDLSGRVIESGTAAETNLEIQVAAPSGVYLVEITADNGKVERHKLILSD